MSRPKGYAAWAPAPETVQVIRAVNEVLEEYRDHLPMTCRQIFYRLVGTYGYDKTERAYKRLCEYLVRARRAHLISWYAIRDDGTTSLGGGGYDQAGDFWASVRYSAKAYKRHRMQSQPIRIELWCEASGMAPQLARAVREWSIPVYSTGGFSSVTVTHEIAERVAREAEDGEDGLLPTVFMHVGDFDPSGESIFESMAADIEAFIAAGSGLAGIFQPRRIALTRAQVEEFGLPTAPPKKTDTRSRTWVGETTQAEAMPPDLLADVVRQAVRDQLDLEILEETLAAEKTDLAKIERVLATVDESA